MTPHGFHLRRLLSPIALLALAIAVPGAASAQSTRNMTVAAHLNDYPGAGPTNYSACWSYVHFDGREYAVIGVGSGSSPANAEGTAIYNVTNPFSPYLVGFIPGPKSLWREMKQYRNWIYVVTEGTGTDEGVQIIRMTNPESPVLAATYTGLFHRSHTVAVDTARALLVCNGTRVNAGGGSYYRAGMRVLSLANPEAPVEIAQWPSTLPAFGASEDTFYVHDSVPVGNRLYASSIYFGIQRVMDFTNPANPVQIAEWTYPGGFTHNAWPDKTGNWLYVTDEKNGEPLKVFDISNLSAPVLFNRLAPNPAAIVHNAHVKGDDLYLASYTEGVRILDASDPGHPAEFAFADTWAGISGDYNGVWEACPFFPSGTVIASDRSTGLWVFRPQRNYGLVRVKAVEAGNGQPLPQTQVFVGSDSLSSTADGVVVFALDPALHTLTLKRFGYESATVMRNVTMGSRDTVVVPLVKKPAVTFSGTIQSSVTLAPLVGSQLDLDYTPLHGHVDGAGHFHMTDVPVDLYRVVVRCPAYIPVGFERQLGPGDASMNFRLVPAPTYLNLESAAGWTIGAAGDNADTEFEGCWILADPIGTTVGAALSAGNRPPLASGRGSGSAPAGLGDRRASPAHEGHYEAFGLTPGPVQPEDDRSPIGTMCFVTGLGVVGQPVDWYDLDGRTTLTSPTFNLTGMTIPTIGYWRWFFTNTGEVTDYLEVQLSNNNGTSWVTVETVRGLRNHWHEAAIRVADFLTPTSQMKVRFVAADEGGGTVVEAAIDDVILYDGATIPVGAEVDPGLVPARFQMRIAWPNPSSGSMRAVLDLPRPGSLEARVIDVNGRRVATLFQGASAAGTRVLNWDGRDAAGHPAPAGVYFVVARHGGASASARFVRLP